MLEVLLSFVYIFIVLTGLGLLVSKLTRIERVDYLLLSGIVFLSVLVEYFSIISRIGIVVHLIVLVLSLLGYFINRKSLRPFWNGIREVAFSWEGVFYILFALLIAFYGSRGMFHTDTNIYHASNIRIYEEYGLIKGMGNLQQHYAYNSSYLAFASFFSMRWLFGDAPLHTTTAFLECAIGIYAFYGLKRFKSHKLHLADALRVAILFYILIIITGSMSPATDYGTQIMALFVMSLWCEEMEGQRRVEIYAFLSVAAVFVVTMKFSAGLIALIAIIPAIELIKSKSVKDILRYLGMGVFVLLPFLIRNFLISGWLLYPFAGIDIFDVEWKVPLNILETDLGFIKVWGRALFDINLADTPFKEWFPVWFDYQDRYEMMLFLGIILGMGFSLLYVFRFFFKKTDFRGEYLALTAANMGCIIMWFFSAPTMRFGLAFILTIIILPLGCFISEEKSGFYAIVTGCCAFGCIACLTPYFDNYIKDAGTTLKQNITKPYYITQQKYDDGKTGSVVMNGNTIYYCDEGEINSSYYCPNTCYYTMLERTEMIGDRIKDGFRPK